YPGADGLKTGYTTASGHNLVTSAVRGGVRLVGVELGCATNGERDAHMAVLLDAGFTQEGVPVNEHPLVVARGRGFPTLINSARAAEPERRSEPGLRRVATQLRPAPVSHWAIQAGSFANERAANAAAASAHRSAGAGAAHVEHARIRGHNTWRAQVLGLTPAEASAACDALTRHRAPCAVIRPEAREVARL
ncbi:MAG: SPOR domain-containing protein, partial [Acetobacteraceae bacterium]